MKKFEIDLNKLDTDELNSFSQLLNSGKIKEVDEETKSYFNGPIIPPKIVSLGESEHLSKTRKIYKKDYKDIVEQVAKHIRAHPKKVYNFKDLYHVYNKKSNGGCGVFNDLMRTYLPKKYGIKSFTIGYRLFFTSRKNKRALSKDDKKTHKQVKDYSPFSIINKRTREIADKLKITWKKAKEKAVKEYHGQKEHYEQKEYY